MLSRTVVHAKASSVERATGKIPTLFVEKSITLFRYLSGIMILGHVNIMVLKPVISLLLAAALTVTAFAQAHEHVSERNRWSVRSDFEISSSKLRNLTSLDSLCARIDSVFRADGYLHRVSITGFASPDGPFAYNKRLSTDRAAAVKRYLDRSLRLSDSIVVVSDSGENWDGLIRLVTLDKNVPQRAKVLKIISENYGTDRGERLLRQLPATWKYLKSNILPQLRYTEIVVDEEFLMPIVPVDTVVPEPEPVPVPEPEPAPEPVDTLIYIVPDPEPVAPVVPEEVHRNWYMKSSVPAWASAVANVAGEYDFADRWSAQLDLRYSAWNYGRQTRKFRTFQLRPEVRYWFRDGHNGLFVDAHLAMISYNVALPSWEFRIQDRGGKHPALGGGLGVGYRLNLSRDSRWRLEGSLGFGVYHLDYNRFYNKDHTRLGQLFDTRKRTFAGVDNVSVSVVYVLNLNREDK